MMWHRGLVSLLLVLCAGTLARAEYMFPENGHWYRAVHAPEYVSWTEARDSAVAMGGYLATITSAEENNFVYSLISDDSFWRRPPGYVHGVGPWIGGTDFGTERSWRWITGEAWSYSNWGTGEPNNHPPGEHYLQYWAYNNFKAPTWNDHFDVPTDPVAGYVVEFDTKPVPEPSSLAMIAGLLLCGAIARVRGRSGRKRR